MKAYEFYKQINSAQIFSRVMQNSEIFTAEIDNVSHHVLGTVCKTHPPRTGFGPEHRARYRT